MERDRTGPTCRPYRRAAGRWRKFAVGAADGLLDVADAVAAQRVPGAGGQSAVAGEQDRVVERLGERQVGGVVGGEVVSQVPDARA